jgi:FMN phosphatase YigB (HAD superfamily)
MAIRAVVFDRDGVLTYFDIAAATNYLRRTPPLTPYDLLHQWEVHGSEHGFPTSLEMEREFFRSYWVRVFARYDIPPAAQHHLHAMSYIDYVKAFPDAPPVLASLHAGGLRIGVLSNFSLASLDDSLAAAGLSAWIDATAAATVIGAAKPAAAAYHTILDRLGVTAAETLFFDDEPVCVEGAHQVGMHAFRVDRRRTQCDLPARIVASLADAPAASAWLRTSRAV